MPLQTLIFVYRADAGLWNGLMDSLHKTFFPRTYPCHLCAITYGSLRMKTPWRDFVEALPVPVRFYHQDDFPWRAQFLDALPAVFVETERGVEMAIHADYLNTLDLDGLIQAVEALVQRHQKG